MDRGEREETRTAVRACGEALRTQHTPEELERASCPPYPFPDRVRSHQDVVLAEVERRAERVSDTFEPLPGQGSAISRVSKGRRLVRAAGGRGRILRALASPGSGQERDQMGELEQTLVESVARVHSWRAAVAVAGDERLGPAYQHGAFAPLADAGEVEQLCELFSAPEGAGILGEVDELAVLTSALVARARRTGVATREPFTGVLHRIIGIDRTAREDMRRRDGLMHLLWPAYPDAQTLALARRSVRAAAIKRELKPLAPEIARPDEDV